MKPDSLALPAPLPGRPTRGAIAAIRVLERIPHSLIALLGRCSLAAVFWNSGQTKIEGFALDLAGGPVTLGWPRLADSAVVLFRDEYRLPLVPPELAAYGAASAEHLFPVLLLLGLGTRVAALSLLIMTAIIQFLVYPDAWPLHGTWATILLYLAATGPGRLSLDHWISRAVQGREGAGGRV